MAPLSHTYSDTYAKLWGIIPKISEVKKKSEGNIRSQRNITLSQENLKLKIACPETK